MDGRSSRRSFLLGVLGSLVTVTVRDQPNAYAHHRSGHIGERETTTALTYPAGCVTPNVERTV